MFTAHYCTNDHTNSIAPHGNIPLLAAGGGYHPIDEQQQYRMIPIVLSNNNYNNNIQPTIVGYEAFGILESGNTSSTSSSHYDDNDVLLEHDVSPEEQQRCPTMLIHLKSSNGTKRKILQDITWELYHYDGLMMQIGKLFPQEQQVKVSYVIGKKSKIAILNDDDWQYALQQLLLNDESIIKIFIKSDTHTSKKKNHLEKIVHKHDKFKIKRQLKDSLIDTSNIRRVYIDAGSILLQVRDLKSLAFNSDKDIAEKTLLRLAKSLHQTDSFDYVHVFFNSTMDVQPEENEAGTFVVSIAESFSSSGDMMVEFLNRQIIAGALESCLVVSCDRVLLKELNNMGVKICNAHSWFKLCQNSDELTNANTTSKIWLKSIISEITSK